MANALARKDLLEQFKLPVENMTRPVIGIVSRFVDQKGFDIFAEAAAELLQENLVARRAWFRRSAV